MADLSATDLGATAAASPSPSGSLARLLPKIGPLILALSMAIGGFR